MPMPGPEALTTRSGRQIKRKSFGDDFKEEKKSAVGLTDKQKCERLIESLLPRPIKEKKPARAQRQGAKAPPAPPPPSTHLTMEALYHLPLMGLLRAVDVANNTIDMDDARAQMELWEEVCPHSRPAKRPRVTERSHDEEEMECEDAPQEETPSSRPQQSFCMESQVRHSSTAELCTRAGAQARRRPSTCARRLPTNHQRPTAPQEPAACTPVQPHPPLRSSASSECIALQAAAPAESPSPTASPKRSPRAASPGSSPESSSATAWDWDWDWAGAAKICASEAGQAPSLRSSSRRCAGPAWLQ